MVERPDLGVPRWRALSEMVGTTLVAATLLLVIGGLLGAMVTPGVVDGTARLELLSRSANPTVATMVLVGLALIVVPKVALAGPSWSFAGMASVAGALVALVVALLAISAMLLDLTTGARSAGLRLSLLIFRFGTLVPAAVAVWLGGVVAGSRPATPSPRPGPSPAGSTDRIGPPPQP